jgi:DNA-binding response OmpR family regulator
MTAIMESSQIADGGPKSLGTVVVVEDPLVSKLVRAVLQRRGYEVKLAGIEEAAALLASASPRALVLVTNSPDAFLQFAERVPLVYLTSAPNLLLESAYSACQVVVKPFIPADLVRAVDALTEAVP